MVGLDDLRDPILMILWFCEMHRPLLCNMPSPTSDGCHEAIKSRRKTVEASILSHHKLLQVYVQLSNTLSTGSSTTPEVSSSKLLPATLSLWQKKPSFFSPSYLEGALIAGNKKGQYCTSNTIYSPECHLLNYSIHLYNSCTIELP